MIDFISDHVQLDWAMFACSITPYTHTSFARGLLKKLGKQVFAVDPSTDEIEGDKAYADLAAHPRKVDAVVLEVPKPEFVKLGCDIHPWMAADLHVHEHPWFDVSAGDGSFSITDLPPGTWEFEALHPKLGKARSEPVTLAGGAVLRLDLAFAGR